VSYRQDDDTTKLFGLFFLVVPGLYLLVRVLPYVLFYALPVVVVSAAVAALWRLSVHLDENRFRSLVLAIPATAILLLLLVGIPEATKIEGNYLIPSGQYFFQLFNRWNAGILGFLYSATPEPFDGWFGLRSKASPVLYDWNTVRWLLWISTGIGAPVAFIAWSRRHEHRLEQKHEEQLKTELAKKDRELDELKARAKSRINEIIREKSQVEERAEMLAAEAKNWKALADFKTKADSAPVEGMGVLDSDAL
jgi:hypothetical protein